MSLRNLRVLAVLAYGLLAPTTARSAGAAAAPAGATVAAGLASHPWELSLAPADEPGKSFVLEGRLVWLPDSLPIRDATVYLYHADTRGRYSEQGEGQPRLKGRLHTNVAGGFRVRTVLPGQYNGVPHIHLTITAPGIESFSTTLSLARSHGAGSDTAYNHVPWMVTLPGTSWAYVEPDGDGGYHCRWTLGVRRPAYR